MIRNGRVLGAAVAAIIVGSLGALAGCSSTDDSTADAALTSHQVQAASVTLTVHDVNGTQVGQGAGILIGPRLVLTAAHLVAGMSRWEITSADGKVKSNGIRGMTYDWMNYDGSDNAHPRKHDVAVIYLDKPINMDAYPKISSTVVADGQAGARLRSNGASFANIPSTFKQVNTFPHAFITDLGKGESVEPGGAVLNDNNEIVGLVTGKGLTTGALYVARTNDLTEWLAPKAQCGGRANASIKTYGTPPPKPGCDTPGNGSSSGASSSGASSSGASSSGASSSGASSSGASSSGASSSGASSSGASSSGNQSSSSSSGGTDNPSCNDGGGHCHGDCHGVPTSSSSSSGSSGTNGSSGDDDDDSTGSSSGASSSGASSSGSGASSSGASSSGASGTNPSASSSSGASSSGASSSGASSSGAGASSSGASSSGASGTNPSASSGGESSSSGASSSGASSSGASGNSSSGAGSNNGGQNGEVCEGPTDNPEKCPVEPDGCEGNKCGGAYTPDSNIDYGGCSGCGVSGDDDDLVVR